jgi:hypothetical protein
MSKGCEDRGYFLKPKRAREQKEFVKHCFMEFF